MGGNFCSHGCFYCYANLNQPNRTAAYSDAQLFMTSNSGIRGYLKGKNYPIVCSNDSDPFAKSNVEQFLQVRSLFSEKGKRIAYQTRGGVHAMDTLTSEAPTLVYISLTSDKPEICKANEPGAPTYESRIELIEACVKAGHFVIAGINPFKADWWDDIHGQVERLANIGVKHAWVGQLHFGSQQLIAMPESRKAKNAADLVYGKKLVKPDNREFDSMLMACAANGINVLEGAASCQGGFWDDYFKLGFDWFPTMDGLITELKEKSNGKPVAFTYDWFCNWADVWSGIKSSQFKEYLVSFGRTIRNTDGTYKANTMNEAHKYMWQILKYPSRFRHENFGLLMDGADVVADGDMDVLVYQPESSEALGVDYKQVSHFLQI
jgi:DNA repair photolyase